MWTSNQRRVLVSTRSQDKESKRQNWCIGREKKLQRMMRMSLLIDTTFSQIRPSPCTFSTRFFYSFRNRVVRSGTRCTCFDTHRFKIRVSLKSSKHACR